MPLPATSLYHVTTADELFVQATGALELLTQVTNVELNVILFTI